MIKTFNCLYTSQKTKKRKTWNDGILKIRIFDSSSSEAVSGVKRPLSGHGKGLGAKGVGGGAASGASSFGGMGILLASGGSTLALEQSLGSRPLSPDEVASLLRNEIGELEFDNYIITIEGEADPALNKGPGPVPAKVTAPVVEAPAPVLRPPTTATSGLLKLPKFKIPSTVQAPVRPANNDDGNGNGASLGTRPGSVVAEGAATTRVSDQKYRTAYGGYGRGDNFDDLDDIWGGSENNQGGNVSHDDGSVELGESEVEVRSNRVTETASRFVSRHGNCVADDNYVETHEEIYDAPQPERFVKSRKNKTEDRVLSPLWAPAPDGRPSYDPALVWGFGSQEDGVEEEGGREEKADEDLRVMGRVGMHDSSAFQPQGVRNVFASQTLAGPGHAWLENGKEDKADAANEADIWDF